MFSEIQKDVDVSPKDSPQVSLDVNYRMAARNNVARFSATLIRGCDHQSLDDILLGSLGLIETIAVIAAENGIDMDEAVKQLKTIHGNPTSALEIVKAELVNQGYEKPALPDMPDVLGEPR